MNKQKKKNKSGFSFSIIITRILFIISVTIYLLTILAPFTPPDTIAVPALLGIMILPILIFTIVIIVLLAILRQYKLSGILLLLVLVSMPLWNKTIILNLGNTDKESQCDNSIKVMTYNVEMFSTFELYADRFEKIKQFIYKENPDIVFIQEFGYFKRHSNDKYNSRSIQNNFRDNYPYQHVWYKNQTKRQEHGVLVLSKYPLSNKNKLDYDSKNNVSTYCDVTIGCKTIRIINNHLESYKLTNDQINLQVKDKKALYFRMKDAMISRAEQAESIHGMIKNSEYPVIVAGDFNDVPMSYTYHIISQGLNDAYAKGAESGNYYTFHKGFAHFPIDHILVDKSIKVIDAKVAKVDYSDHYPVMTTLCLSGKQ